MPSKFERSLTLKAGVLCFLMLNIMPSEAETGACLSESSVNANIQVLSAGERSVYFCDLYYYLKSNASVENPAGAFGRPGALHYAAENLLLISVVAERASEEGGDDEELLAWKKQDSDLRKRMRRYVDAEVASRFERLDLNVLAAEYYAANLEEFQIPRKVDVDHILISADGRGYSAALREIESIQAKLAQGADFRELALKFSDDESVETNAGHIGVIERGVTYPTFEKAAYQLNSVGQVSEPVFSIFGIHLIRLNSVVEAKLQPYDLAAGRIKQKLSASVKLKLREQILSEERDALAAQLLLPEVELFNLYRQAFSAQSND